MAYTVEFVRVPPEEIEHIGLAVLHRAGERTTIYCAADQISQELVDSLTQQGTAYSRNTIRYDHPVGARAHVVFRRLDAAEMPEGVINVAAVYSDGPVTYLRADMITEMMAVVLQEICAEETRFMVRLPVIAPAVPGTATPSRGGRRRARTPDST